MRFFAELFSDTAAAVQEGQTYNYWSEFVNMLLTLGFIVGLIVLTVFILKRIMRSKIKHLNKTTGIKILEKRMLNQKSALYLIEVLGKGIVIAESPAGIHLVTEFGETNIEEALEELKEEQKSVLSFAERLKNLATRNG